MSSTTAEIAKTENVRIESQHGVLVVHILASAVVHETTLQEIQDAVLARLSDSSRGLLVNCAAITGAVSSQFLRLLVCLRRACNEREIRFGLVNLSGNVMKAMRVTNMDSIIPIHSDLADAIWEFRVATEESGAGSERNESNASSLLGNSPRQLLAAVAAAVTLTTLAVAAHRFSVESIGSDPRLARAQARELRATGTPFESELHGKVTVRGDADHDALVVVWPVEHESAIKPTRSEVLELAGQADATRQTGWPRITSASPNGAFRVRVNGRGDHVKLHVLVISQRAPGNGEISVEDFSYLAATLKHPEEIVADKAHSLRQVVVESNAVAKLEYQF